MINIFAANKFHRGPGKVYQNLIAGFEKNNQKYCVNDLSKLSNKAIVLQDIGKYLHDSSNESFFGPNIFNIPSDREDLCKKYRKFIVASQWMKDKYQTFDCMSQNLVWVWPVGVDTEYWCPPKNKDFEIDCFIYYKNRDIKDLKIIAKFLQNNNFSFKIIEYGKYNENQLKELCEKSRFCILLNNTEGQGLAVMEMMSANIPLFVLDKTFWQTPDTNKRYPATSVPYFSSACGLILKENIKENFTEAFEKFIFNLSQYSPREYIVENHNLSLSAKKLVELYEST